MENKKRIPWNKGRICPEISAGRIGQPTWNKGLRGIKTSNKGQISNRKMKKILYVCPICKKEKYARETLNRIYCSPECHRAYLKTDEGRAFQRKGAYSRKRNPIESTPERLFAEILHANNIKYKKGNGKIGNPDFIIDNLYIFIDGEYWHNYPNLRDIDVNNNIEIEKAGFKVIRFWVKHDFYKDPTKCLNIILENLKPKGLYSLVSYE